MALSFPWPTTEGEWLAWTSAAITVAFGLMLMFAPRLSFRLLRLQAREGRPTAIGEARSTMSGFYLGLGICCLLTAQPWLYMGLGFSWAFTAFGRLISMMSDGANTPYNWLRFAIEGILAALSLVFVFGLIP
ncbi:DUF4345 domain-containing protein [Mesorhizobium sp. NBSH29]|uniref:AGROH133_08824 family phage infection protein n=1 Tax=Mesorhizobium sp. NBSH29 TaxID=2654249 RepID=UPI0018968E99|nr:DUF4345 family protein [Mesorhizobium sp. NBSH29]QPC85884.1 DUF4345 domain-containing protein [Mesorhizobium sp. NBSH29]